jgi:hypothetical protein
VVLVASAMAGLLVLAGAVAGLPASLR